MGRAIFERGQHRTGGDGTVIVDQPSLGAAGTKLREVDLLRVRQPDRDPVDVDFLRWRCHLLIPAHDCRHNVGMDLPVMPPVSPMLAKSVQSIPPGASYEPKWDGFRSILFRDGEQVEVGSRNEKP